MHRFLTTAIVIASTSPAFADEIKIKPIIDTRLRYENVDQAGLAIDSDAVTLRMRAGVEAETGTFSILVEGEGTLALIEDYASGVNGKPGPVIPDPENIELNRAQILFTGIPRTVVTAGRQRINLDDQRFVGNAGWRQNEQTFDAVRVEWSGIKGVKADVTYSWSNRTIWGVDGFGALQQAISGDNVFANLSYKTKTFGLTSFAYLIDQDEPAVQGFRLSSQTYGARATASVPLGEAKLGLIVSYARQSDYRRNPNNHAADYWLSEATMDVNGFKLLAGYEELGAESGGVLISFQAPLATLHKFNGTADKLLVTPPNGLRDYYVGASKSFKLKALPGLNAGLTLHRFTSDRRGLDYGGEWDAQIGWKLGKRMSFLAKYTSYNRKGTPDFAGDADTDKLWTQLEYEF